MEFEEIKLLIYVVSGLFGFLLTFIGYFLRQIHADFKRLADNMNTLSQQMIRQEEKGRSGHRLLSEKMVQTEKRLDKIEKTIYQ